MFLLDYFQTKYPNETEYGKNRRFINWCLGDGPIEEILEEYPFMIQLKLEDKLHAKKINN
jgi:hypothetical protein